MALNLSELKFGEELLKSGFAKMTKGGVIMDVTNADQARIAESAGAVAVMALEKVPSDIRAAGGVARMADPAKIKEIIDSVTIPVMAKVRIGHISEGHVLEALGVDMLIYSLKFKRVQFHRPFMNYAFPSTCIYSSILLNND